VLTGEPRRTPEPRQPLRDERVAGSRFSTSTAGSYGKPEYLPLDVIAPQQTGASVASSSGGGGSESRNPFRR